MYFLKGQENKVVSYDATGASGSGLKKYLCQPEKAQQVHRLKKKKPQIVKGL